ncbi:MAG: hypothetical protein WCK31_04240 [bacterium]
MKDIFKFEPLFHLPDEILLADDAYMHYTNEQYVWKFDNNYGVSAVYGRSTKGSEMGLWECAVIKFWNEDNNFDLDYTTDVLNDVEGYCSTKDINELCTKVNKLPFTPLQEDVDTTLEIFNKFDNQ